MTTLPLPDPLVRQAAAAVAAQSDMPFDPVRYGKALDLVLAGAVTLLADGAAAVTSGDTTYIVAETCTCGCADAQYRGVGCKHFLAAAMTRATCALLAENGTPALAACSPAGRPAAWTRQQAPATCFVECQVGPLRLSYTFRGTTDAEVLTRLRRQLPQLQALLAAGEAAAPAQGTEPVALPAHTERAPALTPDAVQALVQQAVQQALAAQSATAQPDPTPVNGQVTPNGHSVATSQTAASQAATPSLPAPAEGWCPVHQVAMRQRHNAQGVWWSHRLGDGRYCKGESA